MKKALVLSVLGLASTGVFAQGLDAALEQQYKKEKEKTDAKIQDPKANVKAATWVERAKIYENIAAHKDTVLIDPKAGEKALEAYKKVLELDVTKKGEPGKSAKDAQRILAGEEATELYNGFVNLGVIKFQSKDLSGALVDFSLAQDLYKKDTTAALFGGITAQQLDKNDVVIKSYTNFLNNGGKDPGVIYALSQVHKNSKDYDKAIAVLQAGLKANPGQKDLQSEIVNILLASGKEDEAVKELTALVEQDPTNVQNLVNLGILFDNSYITHTKTVNQLEEELSKFGAGKAKLESQIETENSKLEVYEGEVKRLTARIKTQPKNAELKRQLSDVQASIKSSKDAITKLEDEIKAADAAAAGVDKSGLEKQLAEAKSKQSAAKEKGLDAYKKAIVADPNNYDAQFGLGAIYYNEGVEIKREVDGMNMTEYQQRGKDVESKLCGKFKKSRPYFEKAAAIRADSDAATTLENVNNIIKQLEGKNIPCVE